ncbi:MAG: glucose 1-dehydrogenase [SAR202 cluster bacterium]|nr:glucose 1-dehydrogenase [SAR202 cluster bacterium]
MRLKDKVALITGGARGMGAAEARLFACEGACVVVADVVVEQGVIVADHIRAKGGKASFVKLDVTSEKDWETAVEGAVRSYGKLNVLVNNAGIYRTDPLERTTLREWDEVMRINITGAFLGIKHVIPAMRRAKGGAIVNVSSTTALVASGRGSAYGASKAALLSLTRHAAVQHAADGIRVNALVPGPVDTEMIAANIRTPEGRAASIARIPMGRIASADELAYGALFLASDESSYMTGAQLVVDGGLTAQ